MRVPERLSFPLAEDDRGALMAVEFSAVPFAVRRVFSVTGPEGGSVRGRHVVPCAQLIVLSSGAATVRLGRDEDSLGPAIELETPGHAVALQAGEYVWYHLHDATSSVLVFAEQPYTGGTA